MNLLNSMTNEEVTEFLTDILYNSIRVYDYGYSVHLKERVKELVTEFVKERE